MADPAPTVVDRAKALAPPAARDPLQAHLDGGTSADWLAHTLTAAGIPVSASSIRAYRRARKMGSVR